MKLSIFLLLAGVINIMAGESYSQSTKVSLNMQNVRVEEVLNEIESKSEFYFLFNQKLVDVDRKVNVSAENISIKEVLADLFDNSDVNCLVYDRQIILAPKEMSKSLAEEAQQIKVTGTVTDGSTGEPLTGVNILIEGTLQGAVSDNNGKFSVVVPSNESVLVFSFVGYNTEKIPVAGQSVITVSLTPDIQSLDEVVVIGYGTRQKKDVTTAIATINSKDIENLSNVSAEMAMQGKMAGVQVVSGGNTPTSRPTVRIRGLNTWQSAEPLYVIDGVPVTEYGSGAESRDPRVQDLRSPINIMSFINPDDIESISVLKDASSAAIYGVRAANGVILITTKKGKQGKATVEYSMNTGWQNIPNTYDVLNTRQMLDFYRSSYSEAKKYKPTVTLPGIIDPASSEFLKDTVRSYNWQNPYLNKNAQLVSHQVRVSGGTDRINYYVSGGYDRTEAAYVQNNLERYSIVTNLNAKISKYISTGVNLRVSYAKALENNNWNGGGATLNTMARMPAWQPIYDPDGASYLNGYAPAMDISYGGYADGIPPKMWNYSATKLWGPQTSSNGFGMMSTQHQDYKLLRNMGTMYVEISPIEGLSFKGTLSGDWYTNLRSQFSSIYQQYFNITPVDPTSYSFPKDSTISTLGTYGERQVRNTNLVYNLTAHYAKSFDKHNIDFVFDYMNQNYRVDFTDGSTNWVRGLGSDFWTVGGPQGRVSGFTGWDRSALNGYMGRVSYDYNSKYYVAFTLRRDGTSKFAPDKRWGWFPSVSAAWRISAESFMSSLPFITDMKIRYGWGQLGNQETAAFPYLSTVNDYAKYSLGTAPNGMGVLYYGFSFPDFPNSDLIWERTTSQNIGIDAVLFSRLDLTVEYYNKLTDGILQATRLPGSVGAWNPPVVNVGKVRNSGFEAALNYHGNAGEFSYSLGANITTNKNEVVKLFGGSPLGGQYDRIEEGKPIRYLWGYKLGGILQNDEEVAAYTDKVNNDGERSDIQPGDMWFVDQNGDSTLNDKDYVYMGKTLPGFFYGINLAAAWKGIDFSLVLTGVGDVQAYNGTRAGLEATGSEPINLSTSVLNSWTPQNHSKTMPRAVYEDPAGNGRMSSRFVESAAYLRLSNLELGYTLPRSVFDKLQFASSLRMYIAGSNLMLLTKWNGLDPENEGYPLPRIWRVGLKVTF